MNFAHTISSSDGLCLRFETTDKDLLEEYERAEKSLNMMFYRLLRKRNGIWASNQGRYVKRWTDLNSMDSSYMEINA